VFESGTGMGVDVEGIRDGDVVLYLSIGPIGQLAHFFQAGTSISTSLSIGNQLIYRH
jgi:hypothetical protein